MIFAFFFYESWFFSERWSWTGWVWSPVYGILCINWPIGKREFYLRPNGTVIACCVIPLDHLQHFSDCYTITYVMFFISVIWLNRYDVLIHMIVCGSWQCRLLPNWYHLAETDHTCTITYMSMCDCVSEQLQFISGCIVLINLSPFRVQCSFRWG